MWNHGNHIMNEWFHIIITIVMIKIIELNAAQIMYEAYNEITPY